MTLPKRYDMPDDYKWMPGSTRFPLADLGELAARLGSIVTYDRRGEVIWLDDISKGVAPYYQTLNGTGSEVYTHNENSLFSGFTMRLVAGSDGGKLANISKDFSPMVLSKIGIEVGVSFPTDFDRFSVIITRYDGSHYHTALIQLDEVNDDIEIWKDDGTWEVIQSSISFTTSTTIYKRIKLVADMENLVYTRLLFDDLIFDLSSYGIRASVSAANPFHRINLSLVGRAANNDYCDVGYVIITDNEP